MTEPRTFGVEEELLLWDGRRGAVRPVAGEIVRAAVDRAPDDPDIKHEFFLEQVEVATRPCVTAMELRDQLTRGRWMVADAGRRLGVVPMAVPLPVLPGASGTPTPGERYALVRDTYGQVAEDSLFCALQVHVHVEEDEEAVAVIDRLRPWAPLLLAVSANSHYWRGSDTGFASWRSQLWERWPSSGPRNPFGEPRRLPRIGSGRDQLRGRHRRGARQLRRPPLYALPDRGAARRRRLHRHRGCGRNRMPHAGAGRRPRGAVACRVPTPRWTVDHLRTARARAARQGLSDGLVHPVTGRHAAAPLALAAAVEVASPALENAGDTDLVRTAVARWASHGTGAVRQRAAGACGLSAVVQDLVMRTVALP